MSRKELYIKMHETLTNAGIIKDIDVENEDLFFEFLISLSHGIDIDEQAFHVFVGQTVFIKTASE